MSAERNQTELMELVEILCYGKITPEQTRRLESIIREDQQARQDYVRYTHMHANLAQLFSAEQASPAEVEEWKAFAIAWLAQEQSSASEELVGQSAPVGLYGSQATRDLGQGGPRSPLRLLKNLVSATSQLNRQLRCSPAMLAGLALLAIGFAFGKRLLDTPSTPSSEYVATLQSTTNATWRDSELSTALKSRLMPGTLQLRSGVAEIEFDSGACVLLEGPATFTLKTTMRGFLETGRLVARVPSQATGFTIETPQANVIDLGTEFGVHVRPDGELEVHVFEGVVDLAATKGTAASGSLLRLKAGQARRLDSIESTKWHKTSLDESRFVRKSPSHRIFNSGVDAYGRLLKPGDQDPHWTVTTSSDARFSTPGPAITQLGHPGGLVNGPNSTWISVTDAATTLPATGTYVYETTFDLTGLVPATAVITGQFSVDDSVTDVIINGVSTGVSGSGFGSFIPFSINSGFIAEVNTLEFVTRNGSLAEFNAHGLRVEMKLDSTSKKARRDDM